MKPKNKTNNVPFSKVTSSALKSRAELAPKQFCISNTHQTKDNFQNICCAVSQPLAQASEQISRSVKILYLAM
jgi:uncharacterized lipoprotein YmbA